MTSPLLLVLFMVLLMTEVHASIVITEIMYDPEGSDNNREYVELYAEGIRLDNYTLEDFASTDTLQLKKLMNSSYTLLVEDEFNYTGINASIYTAGKTLGNGLNNDNDLVLLRDNTSSIVDAVLYHSGQGGSNNNMSLCREQHTIYECIPSPGMAGAGQQGSKQQAYTLVLNEFLPDPVGDDKAPLPDGEWIEVYNTGKEEIDLEGLVLYDASNKKITLSAVNFEDDPSLPAEGYKVIYLNGRLLLNNVGFEEFGIQHQNGSIIDEINYDGSQEAVSWSRTPEGYFIRTVPTKGEANNLEAEALLTNISIETLHMGKDGKVKFGEQLRIRLKVYKGDTTKTTVKVYLANITKQTTFNLYTKFTDYIVTVPLQLNPNCQGKHVEGEYPLIVDGFDVTVISSVRVEGINKKLCIVLKDDGKKSQAPSNTEKSSSLKTLKSSQNATVSDSFIKQDGKLVYASSDSKAKRYALYFFCLVLISIVGAYLFDIRS